MRRGICVFALSLLAVPASAVRYGFDLKPANTSILWTLTDVLHTVHGTFNLTTGHIEFDPATGAASGQVIVDVSSGNSGSAARDGRMHAAVLESAKYPEAVFTPDRLVGNLSVPGSSNVKLHGTFRIHGADHEMTMIVQTKVTGEHMTASIAFEVPYVTWGMKDPSNFLLKVSKTVQFSIESSGTLAKQ